MAMVGCHRVPFAPDARALDAEQFYDDHVDTSTPLLVADGRVLGLHAKWTDEYLARVAGTQEADEVRVSEGDDFALTKVAGERTRTMLVRDFLSTYRSERRTVNLYATNLIIGSLVDSLGRRPLILALAPPGGGAASAAVGRGASARAAATQCALWARARCAACGGRGARRARAVRALHERRDGRQDDARRHRQGRRDRPRLGDGP